MEVRSGIFSDMYTSLETKDLDESNNSEESPPKDMASALGTLDMKDMYSSVLKKLSSFDEEEKPDYRLLNDQDSAEGAASPVEEEVLHVSFKSKYFNLFPLYHEYLQVLADIVCDQILPDEPPPGTLRLLEKRQPIRVTQSTLWMDLDEVKASGVLGTLTTTEIRFHESNFELIGSEASYLKSLGIAVDHFYASKSLKQTLSQMEHHMLFSNIGPVMAASEKFLMDLENRLSENVLISQVGDIVLRHCPGFRRLYVPYLTNMTYQKAIVDQLLQHNRGFLDTITKLESDPVCQRQGLKSFLILPFQRITRIKLILETILKLSKPDSESILDLEQAIQAIDEIVKECDNRVKKMEQIEKLVRLEKLLVFDKVKSVPVVVSRRFMVHEGPVRQILTESTYTSRKLLINIYLHLFNDLLIISSKRDRMFAVMDHMQFPEHVQVRQLPTTKDMELPTNSFLLHLFQSQRGKSYAMIIVAETSSDKEAWMRALSSEEQ